ncbi:MAG: HAD-IA family hydrolase [Propionibacteriaceae bacterium]|jgi:phosphonatase-like hydrolase|nr:HAD-IA family hydrolase [Propionibacteriaceae bacterium]
MDLQLAVIDLAGTSVADDGLVEEAFTEAVGRLGWGPDSDRFPALLAEVRRTMGASKISVFRSLLGDEGRAQEANLAFERAYAGMIADGLCRPLPGAEDTFQRLRQRGVKIALTTGFAPATRQALLARLGWDDLVDLALSPAEAGRGRPYPDLILTAALRLAVTHVRAVATLGDTANDVRAGHAAGAGLVLGVLTGAHDGPTLDEAGADAVLPDIGGLVPFLDRLGLTTLTKGNL